MSTANYYRGTTALRLCSERLIPPVKAKDESVELGVLEETLVRARLGLTAAAILAEVGWPVGYLGLVQQHEEAAGAVGLFFNGDRELALAGAVHGSAACRWAVACSGGSDTVSARSRK